MKISYLDFWPGFDPNSNWFNLVFREIANTIEIVENPLEADLIFASSFGSERFKYKNSDAVKIFYTGENERAELTFADYSLSFDHETHDGRNFRLPHWYMYINWWNEPNFSHARISLEELTKSYTPKDIWNREYFCSIVISNPVQNRLDIAMKLNEYKEVHGYGAVFGKRFEGCKVSLLKNFRWNICFENSITEGYITEKFLEAKVAGCIPIYYGPDISSDFNPKCGLNCFGLTKEEVFEKVTEIDNDRNLFEQLVSEPLFTEAPNLDSLYTFLRNALVDKL